MNFQEIRVLPAYQANEPKINHSFLHLRICQALDRQLPPDNIILRLSALACGITSDEIKSPKQNRGFVDSRMLAMVWFYSNTNYSLSKIGGLFIGRNGKYKDHATVLSLLRKYADLIDSDKATQYQSEYFKELLIKYNPKCPVKMTKYIKSSKRKSES